MNNCPVCGQTAVSFMRPCGECRSDILNKSTERCSLCSADLSGSSNPCISCREQSPKTDGVIALGPWSGALREWMSMLKYGGDSRLADWPAEILTGIWKQNWPDTVVVPVPPRRSRIFRNGIDPVGLIAAGMARRGVPVRRWLKRVGNQTQKSLNRSERIRGTALKFVQRSCAQPGGMRIVLLDDVSTTGSTLSVCAGILKSSGALSVYGLTVCKD